MSVTSGLSRFPPSAGDQPPARRLVVTQELISSYADASGDHNPIHLDPTYARKAGLPSTIAHGLLTLGMACALVENWAAEAAWTSRVSCRFSTPVPVGEEVSCSALVTSVGSDSAEVDLRVVISNGERPLTRASVVLRPL
ncbi:MAG: MaoC family dehydratase [Candidatus Dormiibacterota bacterium]